MVSELQSLLRYDRTQGEGRMQLTSIGRSVEGRSLWMVTLSEPAPVSPSDDAAPQYPTPKRLFYLCRQHGHEPASTEAALALIRDLVEAPPDSPLVEDLRHVTVYVVPMANPDGAEAFLRHNAHNIDLNRDWLRRTQPETKALYRSIMRINPDLMTDQHELYPDDPRHDFTETAGIGSGAKPAVIAACDETASVVQKSMYAAGFPITCHWITDHHPARLAHRFGCVIAGIPTILFETNRLKGSGRTVEERAKAHYQFMVAVLQDLAGEGQEQLSEAETHPSKGRVMLPVSRHRLFQRTVTARPLSVSSGAADKDGE
jgi:hypothetical protein